RSLAFLLGRLESASLARAFACCCRSRVYAARHTWCSSCNPLIRAVLLWCSASRNALLCAVAASHVQEQRTHSSCRGGWLVNQDRQKIWLTTLGRDCVGSRNKRLCGNHQHYRQCPDRSRTRVRGRNVQGSVRQRLASMASRACGLTFRSRRTASPPLNSSVRHLPTRRRYETHSWFCIWSGVRRDWHRGRSLLRLARFSSTPYDGQQLGTFCGVMGALVGCTWACIGALSGYWQKHSASIALPKAA